MARALSVDNGHAAGRVSAAVSCGTIVPRPAAAALSLPVMNERAGPSVLDRRAMWAAAAAFWLFVAAMSAAQLVWIAQGPGQRVDVPGGSVVADRVPSSAWIPVTIAVWHLTRRWLPERFGGWLPLLAAHVPVAAAVALIQTLLVTLLALALARQHGSCGRACQAVARAAGRAAPDLHGNCRHRRGDDAL